MIKNINLPPFANCSPLFVPPTEKQQKMATTATKRQSMKTPYSSKTRTAPAPQGKQPSASATKNENHDKIGNKRYQRI